MLYQFLNYPPNTPDAQPPDKPVPQLSTTPDLQSPNIPVPRLCTPPDTQSPDIPVPEVFPISP